MFVVTIELCQPLDQFSPSSMSFVSESMNINNVLRLRSHEQTEQSTNGKETSVLSICCGKDDRFSKSVLEWLSRSSSIDVVNFLQCGPTKSTDTNLHNQLKEFDGKKADQNKDDATLLRYKQQTNMPSVAQWQILQPQILHIGLQFFTERWCAKNCPCELIWRFDSAEKCPNENPESGSDADAEQSDGEQCDSEGRKKRRIAANRKKPMKRGGARCNDMATACRPTVQHTETYKRAMLLHCLSLIAQYRPKVVFIENVLEPTKQAERRRRDRSCWQQMIDIMMAFGVESAYRVRPFGVELRDDMDDIVSDCPERLLWCNVVTLERLDNTVDPQPPQSISDQSGDSDKLSEALRWIYYDLASVDAISSSLGSSCSQHDRAIFSVQQKDVPKKVDNSGSIDPRSLAMRPKKRKSITNPIVYHFPHKFSDALAKYAVCQLLELQQPETTYAQH